MADWTFTPDYAYNLNYEVRPPRINELEDFSEIRGTTDLAIAGDYVEGYTLSGQEIASMMAFIRTRGLTTPFTKLKYDPEDPSFDPDDPADASGPEETVRISKMPRPKNTSLDNYDVRVTFKRLPNE